MVEGVHVRLEGSPGREDLRRQGMTPCGGGASVDMVWLRCEEGFRQQIVPYVYVERELC